VSPMTTNLGFGGPWPVSFPNRCRERLPSRLALKARNGVTPKFERGIFAAYSAF